MHESLKAAGDAEQEGISVEVVDPRTLQPLDEETIVASVKKTNRAVVAHEAVTRMGFGAEVAAVIQYQAFDWLDAPVERVGARFSPLPFAPVMEQFVVPHADDVLAAIKRTVGKSWRPRSGSRGSARGWSRGRSSSWLKSEGEAVQKGEPLYELDTDKVTQEVEAEADGVLLKIAIPQGEVEVGRTIAFIGAEGEAVAVEAPPAPQPTSEPAGSSLVQAEPAAAGRTPEPQATNGRIKASPLARRLARERGIDLASVRGTGPDGRIVAEDVERSEHAPAVAPAAAPLPAGEVESRPLTNIRKTIARRLTQAWTVPAFHAHRVGRHVGARTT